MNMKAMQECIYLTILYFVCIINYFKYYKNICIKYYIFNITL